MAVEWLWNETQCEFHINSETADVSHTEHIVNVPYRNSMLLLCHVSMHTHTVYTWKIPNIVVLKVTSSVLKIVSHIVYVIMYSHLTIIKKVPHAAWQSTLILEPNYHICFWSCELLQVCWFKTSWLIQKVEQHHHLSASAHMWYIQLYGLFSALGFMVIGKASSLLCFPRRSQYFSVSSVHS